MLIFANLCKDVEFEVQNVNGRVFLNGMVEGVGFRGVERNSPCNFWVVKAGNGEIDMKSAVQARMVSVETVYESGAVSREAGIDELYMSFGNKRMMDYVKRKIIDRSNGTFVRSKIQAKIQILPPINENAKDVEEYFVLERMFPTSVLDEFSKINLGSVELHADLETFKQDIGMKIHFLLADCIMKVLEKKYVTRDCLSDSEYSSFFDVIKNEIEEMRLTPLCRDRLAVLCYILLFQIEGFCVHYDMLPKFGFGKEKVVSILKLIGCEYLKAKEMYSMTKKPKRLG
ncbi:hypothetical protein OCOL_001056 [Ordospora colligata]|uniref:Uncharacterized protein n=1 Tax=Ordospora colligata OC4 TaxID=1354746 RepID=A0A0B2UKQ6_9MICR|nr:uncharacterized protein M896_041510 [Ordospora colligata OC4]KHN69953.1 hypothetical protein M896_041510 [Ordospora colligata OC4]TBU16123.1 hypothetical protein CWI41_041500 [Ordospora colligata]TBU16336.1 hypothetical protein CWI40_041500 [Ordospora colligata]